MRSPRLSSLTVASVASGLAAALVLVSLSQGPSSSRHIELYLQVPEPLSPRQDISELGSVRTTALTYDPNQGVDLHTTQHEGSCQLFGNKELAYLDRQHPHCGAHSAISRFTFHRCHDQDFKSKVDCRHHGNLISSNSHYYQTACQYGRQHMSQYFDRHDVQCPDGQVLSSWHLTQQGCSGYQWVRVEFKCREAETTPPEARDTSCQLLQHHPLAYFDRQHAACGDDEVMTGFHLHSGGCHGHDMRFQVKCAKVLKPWYEYGRERKARYKAEYEKNWDAYVKYHAEYQALHFPNSPSGRRIKDKYEYAYKMYRNLKDKYEAIDNERQAIKYDRLYRRFARIPSQDALARAYKAHYDHYHDLFLKAQGELPEPPKLEYPKGTFLGPAVPDRTDPVYWATLWDDQMHEEHKEAKNMEPVPKAKCGDNCVDQAHKILDGADEGLDGILPADPDWGSFPKALVRDPNTRAAQVEDALSTQTWDPLGNADYEERLEPEGKELTAQTGCQIGDEACLRRMGVWPGEKPAKQADAWLKDEDAAATVMHDARERLGDLLPDDPDWDEYPKQILEDPESKEATLRSAQNIQVFNPLDNADIGIVAGAHAQRNDFRHELRTSTGCDLGEKDCLRKFMDKHPKVDAGEPQPV